MRARVDRGALLEALERARVIVPRKSSKRILEAVRLDCGGSELLVSGTDLDLAFREVVDLDGPGEGSALVELAPLLAWLKACEGESVQLERREGALLASTDAAERLELDLQELEEYPVLPDFPAGSSVQLAACELAALARRVEHAAATQLGRYAMRGAQVELDERSTLLVATDGRRLAIGSAYGPLEGPAARAILSLEGLRALPRLLPKRPAKRGEAQPMVELAVGTVDVDAGPDVPSYKRSLIAVRAERWTLTCWPVDGEFPRYRSVVPAMVATCGTLPVEEALQRLKVAAVGCSEEARAVRLEWIAEGGLDLRAQGSRARSGAVVRGAAWTHRDLERAVVGVNPDYLADALKACEADSVELGWNAAEQPLRIEVPGLVCVVMPITIEAVVHPAA